MYADVVFPFNLPPLTYRVPPSAPSDLKGRIVTAPLRGRNEFGLVIDTMSDTEVPELLRPHCGPPGKKNFRDIRSFHEHFGPESILSFLMWLSDYYLTPAGIALKSMFFNETVLARKAPEARPTDPVPAGYPPEDSGVNLHTTSSDFDSQDISVVSRCITDKGYRTFLMHAPSLSDEYHFLSRVVQHAGDSIQGALLLVPEIGQIDRLSVPLQEILGKPCTVFHSRLTLKKRIEALRTIVTSQSPVIIGTRSALLVPLPHLSLIAVLSEQSPLYKGEEGLRYNARDTAVMRGLLQNSCVLLSSVCPSVESIHNVRIGKYTQLGSPERISGDSRKERPSVRIVNMKKSSSKGSSLSGEVLKQTKTLFSERQGVLFLVNRRGYSFIKCDECGTIVRCGKCRVPLVFYKEKGIVRCRYCGYEHATPEQCTKCKGCSIRPSGAGTERIKEEIEAILKTETVLIEKGTKWPMLKRFDLHDSSLTPFVVAITHSVRRVSERAFGAAVIQNIDALLSQPDFRAYERTFQDVVQVSQLVRPEGAVLLQTWNPGNRLLNLVRAYRFKDFYDYELSQRKALEYPPFSRLILLSLYVKEAGKLLPEIKNIVSGGDGSGVELLGPAEVPSLHKSYNGCLQILMKSRDRKLLHLRARNLITQLDVFREVRIVVDVDPLKI